MEIGILGNAEVEQQIDDFCYQPSELFLSTLSMILGSDMETGKLGNEEVEEQMDYLSRLPEELLFSILSRIEDIKFLCQCMVVSKLFASTIHRIKKISLKIPRLDLSPTVARFAISHVLSDVLDKGEEISALIRPAFVDNMFNIMRSLNNFPELECIYVEFPCPISPCDLLFLKWKAKLGSYEPMVESFVSLAPASLWGEYEHLYLQFLEEPPSSTSGEDCLIFPLTFCSEWLFLIFLLVKWHPKLRSLTCTDFHRHGTIVLKEGQISEWRKRLLHEERLNLSGPLMYSPGYVSELHLPAAHYWIKDVAYVFMDFLERVDPESDDYLRDWEYGSTEKLLGEAVREILKSRAEVEVDENASG